MPVVPKVAALAEVVILSIAVRAAAAATVTLVKSLVFHNLCLFLVSPVS